MRLLQSLISRLLHPVVSGVQHLARDELDLLRARFGRKVKQAATAAALVLAAALLSLLAAVGFAVGAGLALAIVMPGWAAALVVTGVLLVFALTAAAIGVSALRTVARPRPDASTASVDGQKHARTRSA